MLEKGERAAGVSLVQTIGLSLAPTDCRCHLEDTHNHTVFVMRYFIGKLHQSADMEVPETYFQRVMSAWLVVSTLQMLELKFHIVIQAYRSFESDLFSLGLDRFLGRKFDRSLVAEIYIRTNQQVLALLTAARAYHDQRPQDLARISAQGKPYREWADREFRRVFDASLDYRVMEALRNYAQHHQLPIDAFSFAGQRVETDVGISALRYTVDPKFNLKSLIENRKTRKKTSAEIEELGLDWIDAKHAVRGYIEGLVEGHNGVRRIVRDEFFRSRVCIEQAVQDFIESSGGKEDGRLVHAYAFDGNSILQEQYLGLDVINNVEEMQALLSGSKSFSSSFISTEVARQHESHPAVASKRK